MGDISPVGGMNTLRPTNYTTCVQSKVFYKVGGTSQRFLCKYRNQILDLYYATKRWGFHPIVVHSGQAHARATLHKRYLPTGLRVLWGAETSKGQGLVLALAAPSTVYSPTVQHSLLIFRLHQMRTCVWSPRLRTKKKKREGKEIQNRAENPKEIPVDRHRWELNGHY